MVRVAPFFFLFVFLVCSFVLFFPLIHTFASYSYLLTHNRIYLYRTKNYVADLIPPNVVKTFNQLLRRSSFPLTISHRNCYRPLLYVALETSWKPQSSVYFPFLSHNDSHNIRQLLSFQYRYYIELFRRDVYCLVYCVHNNEPFVPLLYKFNWSYSFKQYSNYPTTITKMVSCWTVDSTRLDCIVIAWGVVWRHTFPVYFYIFCVAILYFRDTLDTPVPQTSIDLCCEGSHLLVCFFIESTRHIVHPDYL